MKVIKKMLRKRKHLLFLDFEGTQLSHEMIAFGAIKVDLDNHYEIRKIHTGIKYYVKSFNSIGSYVTHLTGITEERLQKEGISFAEALEYIKKYAGYHFKDNMAFMIFGSHDLTILQNSLQNTPSANAEDCHHIMANAIDVSMVLSQFMKDDKNNNLSLIHSMEKFGIAPVGEPHDPLTDAHHLMLLYQGMMQHSEILYTEYLKVLQKQKTIPEPLKVVMDSLMNGEAVTPDFFEEKIKDYIG